MAVTITTTRTGTRVQWGKEAKWQDRLNTYIRQVQVAARRAFMAEYQRQIATRVVPELKRRSAFRTGRLRRSVKVRRIPNGIELRGEFYGAFLNPSQRRLAQEIYKRQRTSIFAACARAARVAVQQVPPT